MYVQVLESYQVCVVCDRGLHKHLDEEQQENTQGDLHAQVLGVPRCDVLHVVASADQLLALGEDAEAHSLVVHDCTPKVRKVHNSVGRLSPPSNGCVQRRLGRRLRRCILVNGRVRIRILGPQLPETARQLLRRDASIRIIVHDLEDLLQLFLQQLFDFIVSFPVAERLREAGKQRGHTNDAREAVQARGSGGAACHTQDPSDLRASGSDELVAVHHDLHKPCVREQREQSDQV
mmetsp:Transcript_81949/g.235445  ORF Transcript_81949/g.235445 Transcript_81949/m.235445 type:complete len:234 (+) Transcript_81949:1637-2338(+)